MLHETRNMRTFLAASVVILSTTAAFAQKVGDRIVVTAEDARLKSQNEIVGSVRRGNTLTVEDLNGDWYRVTYKNGQKQRRGGSTGGTWFPSRKPWNSSMTPCGA